MRVLCVYGLMNRCRKCVCVWWRVGKAEGEVERETESKRRREGHRENKTKPGLLGGLSVVPASRSAAAGDDGQTAQT